MMYHAIQQNVKTIILMVKSSCVTVTYYQRSVKLHHLLFNSFEKNFNDYNKSRLI